MGGGVEFEKWEIYSEDRRLPISVLPTMRNVNTLCKS